MVNTEIKLITSFVAEDGEAVYSQQKKGPEPHYGSDHQLLIENSLVAQMVKNPPAMWETWVQSLDWEDPLEEGMATHSSILTWRIPMDRVHRVAKSRTQLSD